MIDASNGPAGLWVERLALTNRNVIPAKARIQPNWFVLTFAACTGARLRGHDEFGVRAVSAPKEMRA